MLNTILGSSNYVIQEMAADGNIGDEIECQIEFVNLQEESVHDIMVRDVLLSNVEYVQDSTYLFNSNHPDGVRLKENTLTTKGINIGDYSSMSNAYIRFTGRVVDNSLEGGANQLVNWASVTNWTNDGHPELFKDDAPVVVNK